MAVTQLSPELLQGETPIRDSYDVVVVGGGLAGIGAAVGAKKSAPNLNVLLIESEGFLGGAATHRGVVSFCGLYSVELKPRRAVGSLWTEIHEGLVNEGAASVFPEPAGYIQVRKDTPKPEILVVIDFPSELRA